MISYTDLNIRNCITSWSSLIINSRSMSGGWDFTDHGAKRLEKGFIAMNDNLFQWPKMTISRLWWLIKINQQCETFLFLRHYCLCGKNRCPLLGLWCSVTCIYLHIIVFYTGWDTALSIYIHWWTWQNMLKWFCHYIWLFIGQWEQSTVILYITLKF